MKTMTQIFIVDDQPVYREYLADVLSDYELQVMESGSEMLKRLDSVTADLILLDISMPELDGYEVCQRIRSDSRHRFTKIVFLSANLLLEDRLRGYAVGGDDYLVKPINCDELLAKIRVLLRLKSIEEVDRIKNDFLTLISHETRTPINNVKGLCSIILNDQGLSNEQIRDIVGRIDAAGSRLGTLAEKTLLACSLRDPQKFSMKINSIASILAGPLSTVEADAFARGVSLQVNVVDQPFPIASKILHKALQYVLENAVKFAPPSTAVEVRGAKKEEIYRLSISDAGPGVGRRTDLLFRPFAIDDIMHHKAGLGLSLYLAAEIAALHGGLLEVTSPQNPTTFEFSFPL